MSLMADKSPAAAPTPQPQQVPQPWPYNMNMYNMNMFPNPYMYNPAYGAHNYYQYYGQRMPNWGNYRGYLPGQLPWGMPSQPQLPQLPPPGMEQQPQIQSEQAQQPSEEMMLMTTNTNNRQEYQSHDNRNSSFCSSPWLLSVPTEPSPELPPLPPGPPPGTPAPPGTQATPPRQPFHQYTSPPTTTSSAANNVSSTSNTSGVGVVGTGIGPIRFNMNAQRPRPQLSQALNPLGPRPGQVSSSSKKKNKKKKKQQQLLLQQQQQQLQEDPEDDDGSETPPLPASPPPSPPPPPPPATAPPLLPQPTPGSNSVSMPQQPPGIKYIDDWPPSLRDYVNRCYAKCVSKVDMDRVGVILKGKILRATSDGSLWTKNWGEEPLPLDSDSKPLGGLTLGMNLKDKLNKMSSRLGPPQKNQEQLQQRNNLEQQNTPSHKRNSYRPSFKRNYSSDSSSSSSSDSEDNSSSNNKRSRDKRSSQAWNSKRHSSKKSSDKTPHLYKEYGSIGGGLGAPVKKEVLDKRAARFSCDNSNRNKNSLTTSEPSPPSFVIDSKPNYQFISSTVSSIVNNINCSSVTGNVHDWEQDLHIVGTSTDIEKRYLRLTSAPDASQVRPPQVLARALSVVKEKWAKEADYHYTCEQLKSIRQDLTVQGIRDEFTVEVYETHARIALEKGDHAEFNQCQSQLRQLHTLSSKNRGEFVAYRILYYIFTNEFLDLSTLVNSLSDQDKFDECISHGLKMAKAWTTGLHSRLFKLYLSAPRMSPYLIDWFLARERLKALKVIIKAYRPAVPVDLLMKELAFGSIGDTLEFIDKFGLVFTDNSRTMVDCKSSTPILAAV